MSDYSSDVPIFVFLVAAVILLQSFLGYSATSKISLESSITLGILSLAYLIDRTARAHANFMQNEITRLIDAKMQK